MCFQRFVPHGAQRNTPTRSLRVDVLSANLFCAVNNDERAWASFASTVQAVTVRSASSLAHVCRCCGRRRGRVIGSRPTQHTHTKQHTHKSGDRERLKESERGGAWLSFLSQAHNSVPCKHRGKAVYQYTDCLTWAQSELEKEML